MNTIQNAYVNALLADASYVALWDKDKNEILPEVASNLTAALTQPQADYLLNNFDILTQTLSPTGGFDAVVWRGKASGDFAGQVFVSMRGTEPPGVDIWGADVDLAVNVAARTQIIDMVNWWLREIAPGGVQAQQIKWDPLREKPGTIGLGERLYGDKGNDAVRGEVGNDHIEGGAGNDTLQGGAKGACICVGAANQTHWRAAA